MTDLTEKDDKRDDSSKLADEYLQRASYLGTILPLLDVVYEILIERHIKKYNLNIVKEFWIFLGLFVFSMLFYLYGVQLEAVIFFLLATLLTLIIYNLDFFKKRVIPDVNEEIKNFLFTIDQKSVLEVGNFIKQYRKKLKESEIISIIDSSHGNHWLIYDYILKYQNFSDKVILLLIDKNRLDAIGEDLFIKYLKKFKIGISVDNFKYLAAYFRENKRVQKILNLFNPSYVKSGKTFKSAASFIQLFYISATRGLISNFFAFISIILAILAISYNIQRFELPLLTEFSTVNSILVIINILLLIAILTLFIMSFFLILCILISKLMWFILGNFSPEEPQL